MSAHETSALRHKLTKHRELLRRVFYHYRSVDGLQPDLPAGGRLAPANGGPAAAEMHGLPPLLAADTHAHAFVASDGSYAHSLGEAHDPEEVRLSLAQLWRLLKDTRVLGGALTTAEIDLLWAEAKVLENAEARAREEATASSRRTLLLAGSDKAALGSPANCGSEATLVLPLPGAQPLLGIQRLAEDIAAAGGGVASTSASATAGGGNGGSESPTSPTRFNPMAGLELPSTHYGFASCDVRGFAECMVLLAHARYGRRMPTLSAAFDKLCCDHLEEYACQVRARLAARSRLACWDRAPDLACALELG
jgi:hypothetical protein